MAATRVTAFTDACVLVALPKRTMLLTLAATGLSRLRWSVRMLNETERATGRIR